MVEQTQSKQLVMHRHSPVVLRSAFQMLPKLGAVPEVEDGDAFP